MADGALVQAKAYQLNADGTWAERGVGTVQLDAWELSVVGADTGAPVCEKARLSPDIKYRLQQSLLLPLCDESRPPGSLLLSFLSPDDAAAALELVHAAVAEACERPEKRRKVGGQQPSTATLLPAEVTYGNLETIARRLEDCATHPAKKDIAAMTVRRQDYVHKLLAVFDKLDDLDDVPGLRLLYRVFAALFQLSSPELVNELTDETALPTVIAALEHHPKRPHVNHRAVLHSLKLHNPLNLEPQLTHLLSRVNLLLYLRDSVLPVGTDEVALEVLRNQAVVNRNKAVLWIVGEDARVRALANRFQIEDKDLLHVLRFFEELLQNLKTVPPDEQETVYLRLVRCDVLSNVCHATRHKDVKVRQCCSDIVNHFVLADTGLLRDYIMSEPSMLQCFAEQTVREADSGLQAQWQEVARVVLETRAQREMYVFRGSTTVYDIEETFYAMIYRNDGNIIEPLLWGIRKLAQAAGAAPTTGVQARIDAAQLRVYDNGFYSAAPVINTCLSGHGDRASAWALGVDLPQQVSLIAKIPSTLHSSKRLLACLWVLRGLVESDAPALHASIAEHDPFEALMPLVLRRGLVGSTMLSLLDTVWSKNRAELVKLIATVHGGYLEKLAGTHVGNNFRMRHQKNAEEGLYGGGRDVVCDNETADIDTKPQVEGDASQPKEPSGTAGLGGLLNAYGEAEEGGFRFPE